MIVLIAIATFLSTLLGGLFALYLKDKLHLILGFSAGTVLGVAFFDLLPEALDLTRATYDAPTVLATAVIGFTIYLILDRMILLHEHSEDTSSEKHRGAVGAMSLSLHSLIDGIGIGLAFQVSGVVGAIVAIGVLTHDFSDGINTVSLVLRDTREGIQAFRWLLIDAVAPILGVLSTFLFTVSESTLGLLLALFSGFFLYIGASDLIPESYHSHPRRWTTIMTVVGIATLYASVKLAGA